MGVDEILQQARARLRRLSPAEAVDAQANGALLVDTRPQAQRRRQGDIPGALRIERNVLEWRLDPASDARIAEVEGYEQQVVVICGQGYSSSLAAASLQDCGLHRATDVAGGFEAWAADGMPVIPPDAQPAEGAG
jgi:rhodanese-related sulfurtransferase